MDPKMVHESIKNPCKNETEQLSTKSSNIDEHWRRQTIKIMVFHNKNNAFSKNREVATTCQQISKKTKQNTQTDPNSIKKSSQNRYKFYVHSSNRKWSKTGRTWEPKLVHKSMKIDIKIRTRKKSEQQIKIGLGAEVVRRTNWAKKSIGTTQPTNQPTHSLMDALIILICSL